jgi:hypothetical protein
MVLEHDHSGPPTSATSRGGTSVNLGRIFTPPVAGPGFTVSTPRHAEVKPIATAWEYLAGHLDWLTVVVFGVAAFMLRLALLSVSFDLPGDGPSHAALAYSWSKAPYLATWGGWLPGFMYVGGVSSLIVQNPLLAERLANLLMGSLTVPVYYLLVRRVFNRISALFSGFLLLILPLHVQLSASSLQDIGFIFTAVISLLLLITATERPQRQWPYVGLSLCFFCWAELTRYEAWPLIPALPLFYLHKTRNLRAAGLILIIVLMFPVAWMLENYVHTGVLLTGLSSVEHGADIASASRLGLADAVSFLSQLSFRNLGKLLTVAALFGSIWHLLSTVRRRANSQYVFYGTVVLLYWLGMLYVTMLIGSAFWDRYLLFGFMMALPLPFVPFAGKLVAYHKGLALVVCVGLTVAALSTFSRQQLVYVTTQRPTEIENVVGWLKASGYQDEPLLLTSMDWKSTYLPLYLPGRDSHLLIVSRWTEDADLDAFLRNQRPSLLITQDRDTEFQARIEALLGFRVRDAPVLHEDGAITVYLIRGRPG